MVPATAASSGASSRSLMADGHLGDNSMVVVSPAPAGSWGRPPAPAPLRAPPRSARPGPAPPRPRSEPDPAASAPGSPAPPIGASGSGISTWGSAGATRSTGSERAGGEADSIRCASERDRDQGAGGQGWARPQAGVSRAAAGQARFASWRHRTQGRLPGRSGDLRRGRGRGQRRAPPGGVLARDAVASICAGISGHAARAQAPMAIAGQPPGRGTMAGSPGLPASIRQRLTMSHKCPGPLPSAPEAPRP